MEVVSNAWGMSRLDRSTGRENASFAAAFALQEPAIHRMHIVASVGHGMARSGDMAYVGCPSISGIFDTDAHQTGCLCRHR